MINRNLEYGTKEEIILFDIFPSTYQGVSYELPIIEKNETSSELIIFYLLPAMVIYQITSQPSKQDTMSRW